LLPEKSHSQKAKSCRALKKRHEIMPVESMLCRQPAGDLIGQKSSTGARSFILKLRLEIKSLTLDKGVGDI